MSTTTQEIIRNLSLKVAFPELPELGGYPEVDVLQKFYNQLRQKVRKGANQSQPEKYVQYVGMRRFIVNFAQLNNFTALHLRTARAMREDGYLSLSFGQRYGWEYYCRLETKGYNYLRREFMKNYNFPNMKIPRERTVKDCMYRRGN